MNVIKLTPPGGIGHTTQHLVDIVHNAEEVDCIRRIEGMIPMKTGLSF
jgi:hypothetical protein